MQAKFKRILLGFLTIIASFAILYVFYGELFGKTDSVLFSKGGDGLKSYYASHYHIYYDKSYLQTQCMNYPYGEFSFYSDSQPLITNFIKFFQQYGYFQNVNIIGIINASMIYALIVASLILYLLFLRLKLPAAYSLVIANIIVYLSPQLARMGGHYSLSYVLFIPLFIYLLLIFIQKRSYIISLIMGVFTFIALFTHGYYFAFFAFFAIFVPIFYAIQQGEKIEWFKQYLPHVFIQIFLPFLIFNLFSMGIPTDRTAYPWGFFASRAFPESVLLPIGKPYFGHIGIPYLKWEGMAFVGLVSVIVFLILITKSVKNKKWFVLIDNPFLNAILLTSIIALLFSFAYPFTWYLEWLWNYMGPLRQFRASGRFAWLFFYAINIVAFYFIWNWYSSHKTNIAKVILFLAILMGLYDAILNARRRQEGLQNNISEIFDPSNNLPQDKWLNEIDTSKYQTIMPLPYFHVGSEVYWIEGAAESKEAAFVVSWKTGLPINAVLMSRTSISQTMSNLALYFEPNRPYNVIEKYKKDKDILLIVANGLKLNDNEKRFVDYANLIEENDKYKAYDLSVASINKLNADYRNDIVNRSADTNLYSFDGFMQTDSVQSFVYKSFGNKLPLLNNRGSIASFDATKHNVIIDMPMLNDTAEVIISFWINNMDKDILPRSDIKIGTKRVIGDFQQRKVGVVFRNIKYVDENGWGLVEFTYQPQEAGEVLRLEIWNNLTTRGNFEIDDILIRKKSVDVFYVNDEFVYYNNRYIRIPAQ